MKHKVVKKQPNSNKCFVCGLKNDLGLKLSFFESDSGELIATFIPGEDYQGYPDRMHGGIASTILDEIICRAAMIKDDSCWGVTVELNIKYKKPIPLNEELKAIGRVTKENRKIYEGTAELVLKNGDIAVTAHGKYLKVPLEQTEDTIIEELGWVVCPSQDDPEEIEI